MNWASWVRAVRKASWLAVFAALPVGACSAGGVAEPNGEPVASVALEVCQADGCTQCHYCNNGFCDPSPGDSCINGGVCAGSGACCAGCLDSGNACQTGNTTTACGKGDYCQSCAAANECQTNACSSGKCSTPQKADNTACTGGKCLKGACCTGCLSGTACALGTANDACGKGGGNCSNCDTGNECMIGSCTSSGTCSATPAAPGTSCGGGTGKCENGACCMGCWDGSMCQTGQALDVCGKAGADCGSCTDTNVCSTDACADGVCTHDTIPGCSDGKCGGTTPLDCDDKEPCTTDTCDPTMGCVNTPANGVDCDDGDPCTQHDSCEAGTCKPGAPLTCEASDECHEAGSCAQANGKCTDPVKKDGTACTSGTCQSGKCIANDAGGAAGDSGTLGESGAGEEAGSGGNGAAQAGSGTASGDLGGADSSGLYVRNPGGCAVRSGDTPRRGAGALLAAALVSFAVARRRRHQ